MKRRWAYIGENVTSALGELEECIEAGERTFAAVRTTGRGKGSGASYEGWLYQVITTSDDMVTVIRFENYFDRADALEAAGLSE